MKSIGQALAVLFVACLTLVTALVTLATALIDLGAALCARGASRLKGGERPSSKKVVGREVVVSTTSSNTHGAERLHTALRGMGYAAPLVRGFVEKVGVRAESEPLPKLVVEGLRYLSAQN